MLFLRFTAYISFPSKCQLNGLQQQSYELNLGASDMNESINDTLPLDLPPDWSKFYATMSHQGLLAHTCT